jgi:hypothetical protein
MISCGVHTSNIGKTARPDQTISTVSSSDSKGIWQTNDLEIAYEIIPLDDTFRVSGTLHVLNSITATFSRAKFFQLHINYLDAEQRVISSHEVSPNMGYRIELPRNMPLTNVPNAPRKAVSFTFSYWGVFVSPGISDENAGEWEVYFNPFTT